MTKLAASAVRDAFSDTLNRVAFQGERIALERHGKTVAALVSAEDLELLEALEDRTDLAAARRALREPGRRSWAKVKADLGLSYACAMAETARAVQFTPAAQRDLKRIKDRTTLARIARAIDALAAEPRPAGATALQGDGSILRIRVGDYRILYTVEDAALLVLVIRVGHRRDVDPGPLSDSPGKQ